MQTQGADALAQIRAAFPAQPIAFAAARGDGLDGNSYRDHVDGKTWLELDREFILRRADALSFLEARHIAAVLPVYLCSLVQDGTQTAAPDSLLPALNVKSRRRFNELVEALTAAQRAAVIAALAAFMTAEPDGGQPTEVARAALDRWTSQASTS